MGVGFSVLLAILAASALESSYDPALHEQNARAGFAARTAFELVAGSSVPLRAPKVATYSLNPDPDAFGAKGPGLEHLRYVTLARTAASPFLFDLYLHGSEGEASALAVHVAPFDVRKLLHQPPGQWTSHADLARLQAHFAEFSRKAKLIYPKSGASQHAPTDDDEVRSEIRARLTAIRGRFGVNQPWVQRTVDRALRNLEADRERTLEAVERQLALALSEALGTVDEGTTTQDARLALEQLRRRVVELSAPSKISHVRLVNNCREPGNYEITLVDWLGRALVHGSFAFGVNEYDEILRGHSGLGIPEIGSGLRIPNAVWRTNISYYWQSLLPWNWFKRVPRASVDALSTLSSGAASGIRRQAAGEAAVARGRIHFDQYELEVRRKAAFRSPIEPLSYVRVDPDKPMPAGFRSTDRSAPSKYWSSEEHAGKIVPHRYANFSDLWQYDVFLSGFEASGVYVGRSDLEHFDLERESGRWHFDYRYLESLTRYEFLEDENGLIEIHLLADSDVADPVNFVMGNFELAIGDSVEFLLGIAAQPLIADYNEDPYQEVPRYALAYAEGGTILDHHDTGIGVERVSIERLSDDLYQVRLISHERIVPVWEGVLDVGAGDSR